MKLYDCLPHLHTQIHVTSKGEFDDEDISDLFDGTNNASNRKCVGSAKHLAYLEYPCCFSVQMITLCL